MKKVIFLQADKIAIYRLNAKRCEAECEWCSADQQELIENLSEHLTQNLFSIYSLFIDDSEEECHLESLPELGRRDKRLLLHRINKIYAEKYPFTSLLPSLQQAIAIATIPKNARYNTVLEVCKLQGVSLRAIHTPLTLASEVAIHYEAENGSVLLVLRVNDSAYRLLALRDGKPFYSRSIEVSAQDSLDLQEKIDETLTYLSRGDFNGWNSPKVIAPHKSLINKFEIDLPLDAVGPNNFPHSDLSRDHTVKQKIPTQAAISALVLETAKSIRPGLAAKNHRQAYILRKVRYFAYASALCLGVGTLSAGTVVNQLEEEYESLSDEYENTHRVLMSVDSDIPNDEEYPVEAVRQALVTAKLIELQANAGPMEFLTGLGAAKGGGSDNRFSAVNWQKQNLLNEATLPIGVNNPRKVSMENLYQATVAGEIDGEAATVLEVFDTFVKKLRLSAGVSSVVVLESPYNLDTNAVTSANDLSDNVAKYRLEISGGKRSHGLTEPGAYEVVQK